MFFCCKKKFHAETLRLTKWVTETIQLKATKIRLRHKEQK